MMVARLTPDISNIRTMSKKPGRNDPCPCGSGRKYKQCCGKPAVQPITGGKEQAVTRAIQWLETMHRKPFQREVEDFMFHRFWPGDEVDPEQVPEDFWQMIQINVLEWMLARGELLLNNEYVMVQDLLLGQGGPRLNAEQQDYLRQFESNLVRLYYVTDSRPGDGLTLIDALNEHAEALIVQEKSGSQTLMAGDYLGCRVVYVDDHLELSGALYPFSDSHIGPVLDMATQVLQSSREQFPRANPDRILEQWLVERWFEQLVSPPTMPQFMDAATGEPMLLVTDHYQIIDRDALMAKLAASDEMQMTGEYSWDYLEQHDDGMTRARLTLNFAEPQDRHQDRFSVFYRTLQLADEGRPWFEQLAGDSVRHLTRELTDPVGSIADGETGPSQQQPPDIDADDMAAVVTEFMHKHYANWADEPIPTLQNKTPREAIASASGKERVKGLLRSYENGEKDMAASQGREPISYQFLWDELGLTRD